MKKILALVLCVLTVLSVLASCSAAPAKNYSPKITVSSSAADEFAVWLTNRLGDSLKDNVYLSLGGDAANGLDMTNFENDGYILRSDGDKNIVIAGKTADGLDAAVRKYANAVDLGKSTLFDITYHEGYRVEKLTLAGNDISEYTVVAPENDPSRRSYMNWAMNAACNEIVSLIAKACGTNLPAVRGTSDAAKQIILKFSDDESLGNHGYKYYFEGDNLVIEGGPEDGCLNGVYRFLEHELNWECLSFGDSLLAEADYIDVPADAARTEQPVFDWAWLYFMAYEQFKTDRTTTANPYGKIDQAMHGDQLLGTTHWAGQICYTDEDRFYAVYDRVIDYIVNNIRAGKVIGEDFFAVSLAQVDEAKYCRCKQCLTVVKEEGGVNSGPVIRWMNRMVEEVNATDDAYRALIYKCYAYHGSQPPCKTAPVDQVWVTFCTDGACSNHILRGGDCNDRFGLYGVSEEPIFNNDSFGSWLKQWTDMSDNIYVWLYALDCSPRQYTIFETIYDDIQFLSECGVRGFFWQHQSNGLGFNRINFQLAYQLIWNTDMTRDEFNALKEHLLEKEYGEGYTYILEYFDILQQAQDKSGCWNCWGYGAPKGADERDQAYYAENFDLSVELLERALVLAGDKKQVDLCSRLTVHMLYSGCYAAYFEAYDNNDTARLEELNARYSRAIDRIITAYNAVGWGWLVSADTIKIYSTDYAQVTIYRSLEDMAWKSWAEDRDYLPQGETQRPMPDKYAEDAKV